MTYLPPLSRESWLAAALAAERAVPVLLAKGMLYAAMQATKRTKEFKARAAQADPA